VVKVHQVAVWPRCVRLQCGQDASGCSVVKVRQVAVWSRCIRLQCGQGASGCSVVKVRVRCKQGFPVGVQNCARAALKKALCRASDATWSLEDAALLAFLDLACCGTVARWHGGSGHSGTVAQWHSGTVAHWHSGTVAVGSGVLWHLGTVEHSGSFGATASMGFQQHSVKHR